MSKRIKLVCTCGACPEQYDVYVDGECLGYMRLRHGHFYADYMDKTVYSASPDGDGTFCDYERNKYLNQACSFILAKHDEANDNEELLFEF